MKYVNTLLKIFLTSVGIKGGSDLKTKKIISLLILVHLFVTIGELDGFRNASSNIYKYEIVYQVACFLYICATQWISWINRELVLRISDKLKGDLPEFVGQTATVQTERNFKKIAKIILLVYAFTIGTYVTIPWANFIFNGKNYSDPLSYSLPFWFAAWKIDSVRKYVLANVVQNIFCTFIFCVYASKFGFIICIMINCQAHVKEIEYRLNALKNKMEDCFNTNFSACGDRKMCFRKFEDVLIEDFIQIIKYKIVLLQFCEEVRQYLSWIFNAAIGWVILVVVLTLFISTQSVSDVVFKIKLMAVVTNVIFSFFFFCYVAQIIRQINEKCLEFFYDIPWFYDVMRFRKILIILLQQNQKDIEIKAFKMYAMNLSLFTHVLRVIYSCLNVMLMMQK